MNSASLQTHDPPGVNVMAKGKHSSTVAIAARTLALTLLLCGLLLFATACGCGDVNTEDDTLTSTTIAATTTEAPAATTESTDAPEPTTPPTESAEGTDSDDSTPSTYTTVSLLLPSAPVTHLFDVGDNYEDATVRVGDSIHITLHFSASDEVKTVEWNSNVVTVADLTDESWTADGAGFYTMALGEFEALSVGTTGLVALAKHEDGTLQSMFRLNLEVTE